MFMALCWSCSWASPCLSCTVGCRTGFRTEERARTTFLLAAVLLMQPWRLLLFLAMRACCWIMVSLLPTRNPRTLSPKLISNQSGLRMNWCRTWHFLSWGSHLPNSPSCWGPFEWQHTHLVYQLLLPVLYQFCELAEDALLTDCH